MHLLAETSLITQVALPDVGKAYVMPRSLLKRAPTADAQSFEWAPQDLDKLRLTAEQAEARARFTVESNGAALLNLYKSHGILDDHGPPALDFKEWCRSPIATRLCFWVLQLNGSGASINRMKG